MKKIDFSRGAHSRHFSVAFTKNLEICFLALVTQYFMLITNMTLVLGFGHPGRRRKQFQIGKLHFCTFATSPLAALASLTKIPGDPGRPVQPSGLVPNMQKCNLRNFKCLLCFPKAPKPKIKVIFMITGSSLIGKCDNMEFDFLCSCYAKIALVRNLLYTLPTLTSTWNLSLTFFIGQLQCC